MDSSEVSRRAAAVAPSATVQITERAKALKAEGRHVIGFGAGEPDFPTPDHVVQAAAAAVLDPVNHRYSATAGLPELRAAIAAKTARDSGYGVDPSQVLVTNGGKQAIYEICQALLDPGDEVLIPAPYWVTYPEVVGLAGAISVPLPTGEAEGFRVTVDQLDAAWTPRTKLLLFTSPSNPTGVVYPAGDVAAIGRWAVDRGVWVLTDEMYEHLVYDGAEAPSLPVLVPELADRCIVVNAVSKTYAMTGWRVGWSIAPPALTAAAARIQSHLAKNVVQRAGQRGKGRPLRDVDRLAGRRSRHARGVRPAPQEDGGHAALHRRRLVRRAAGRVLRLPLDGRPPRAAAAGEGGAVHQRTGGPRPRRGAGRLRARRGLRCAGLCPVLVCAQRRRPRGGAAAPGRPGGRRGGGPFGLNLNYRLKVALDPWINDKIVLRAIGPVRPPKMPANAGFARQAVSKALPVSAAWMAGHAFDPGSMGEKWSTSGSSTRRASSPASRAAAT